MCTDALRPNWAPQVLAPVRMCAIEISKLSNAVIPVPLSLAALCVRIPGRQGCRLCQRPTIGVCRKW